MALFLKFNNFFLSQAIVYKTNIYITSQLYMLWHTYVFLNLVITKHPFIASATNYIFVNIY